MLEFRIVPGSDDLASGLAEEYREAIIGGRMPTNDRYRWAPVRPRVNPPFDSILVEHDGQRWLLLWNEPSHAMLAEQDWGLKDVYKTTDPAGRPTVGLILDEKGAELFHQLTQANVKKSLAIVLDGEVLSAPTVRFAIPGGQCVIAGNFTDEEVRQIMAVLMKGMADRRTPQSAADYSVPGPWRGDGCLGSADGGGGGERRLWL